MRSNAGPPPRCARGPPRVPRIPGSACHLESRGLYRAGPVSWSARHESKTYRSDSRDPGSRSDCPRNSPPGTQQLPVVLVQWNRSSTSLSPVRFYPCLDPDFIRNVRNWHSAYIRRWGCGAFSLFERIGGDRAEPPTGPIVGIPSLDRRARHLSESPLPNQSVRTDRRSGSRDSRQ